MLVGILQPSYLPWLGFFEQMAKVDVFVTKDTKLKNFVAGKVCLDR